MKSKQISVLIYGHDARLLESRKWVLQSCGYRALSVRHLADLNRVPLIPAVDLLVLCYTLDPRECESAIAHAKLRWPNVKELALVRYNANAAREISSVLPDIQKTLDAPDPLLSMVGQLVGHATSSSYSHIY